MENQPKTPDEKQRPQTPGTMPGRESGDPQQNNTTMDPSKNKPGKKTPKENEDKPEQSSRPTP